MAVPGGGVQPGDAVAEAIYAITDGIPFYNLGAVYQSISGVCGVDTAIPNPNPTPNPSHNPNPSPVQACLPYP